VPRPAPRAKAFGLVLLEVEPDSPCGQRVALAGRHSSRTDEKSFASLDDLRQRSARLRARAFCASHFCAGDYERFRRVAVQLGAQRYFPGAPPPRDSVFLIALHRSLAPRCKIASGPHGVKLSAAPRTSTQSNGQLSDTQPQALLVDASPSSWKP